MVESSKTILDLPHGIVSLPPTPTQARADALVSSFVGHATDGYSLAAMVGGGLVYRLGRVGTLALGSRLFNVGAGISPPLQALIRYGSVGIGFTGEVFTFEAGQRALRIGIGGADPNLLRWAGENGLGRGLVGTAITLGSLKGAGAFVQGQNPVLQHLFQDSAMVLAHNVSDRIFSSRGTLQRAPTLVEQFVEAEATLWQMNAGMSLVHGAFPRLGQVERSLDLGIRSRAVGALREAPLQSFNAPLLAVAGGPAPAGNSGGGQRGLERLPPHSFAMDIYSEEGGGIGRDPTHRIRRLLPHFFAPLTPDKIEQFERDMATIRNVRGLHHSSLGFVFDPYTIDYYVRQGLDPWMVIHNTGAQPFQIFKVFGGYAEGSFPVVVRARTDHPDYYRKAIRQFAFDRNFPNLTLVLHLPATEIARWLVENRASFEDPALRPESIPTILLPSLMDLARRNGIAQIHALPGTPPFGKTWHLFFNALERAHFPREILREAGGENFWKVLAAAKDPGAEENIDRAILSWAAPITEGIESVREQFIQAWIDLIGERNPNLRAQLEEPIAEWLPQFAESRRLPLPPFGMREEIRTRLLRGGR